MQVEVPLDRLKDWVGQRKFLGDIFDPVSLRSFGVFVVKGFFSTSYVDSLRHYYQKSTLTGVKFHPTRIDISDRGLLDLVLHDELLSLIRQNFFNGNVAANVPLIFRKDSENRDSVIVHNDLDYQMGWAERYSLFIPITEANGENGGLKVWPGTHNFGSLGDAGEINTSILPADYPVLQTSLFPGDLLIMHSGVWHSSGPNVSGKDRIYFELKIQSADDPACGKVICGKRSSVWRLAVDSDSLFLSSRTQRLRAFYQAEK